MLHGSGSAGLRRDDGEPLLGGDELPEDPRLDRRGQRGVGAGDEAGQDGDEGRVLAGEPGGLGAAGVDQADAVVGAMPTSA